MSKTEKFRSRTMTLLLYPSDETHVQAMEKIKTSYDYVAILHDKDLDENGEKKKEHWHVILRFQNANWNSAICKDLGIEMNYSDQIRNLDNALMYLIHYNDSDKAQYDISEVFGTFTSRVTTAINKQNKDEGEKVLEIIKFIRNHNGYLTYTAIIEWSAQNGYWSDLRRGGGWLQKAVEEHNMGVVPPTEEIENE